MSFGKIDFQYKIKNKSKIINFFKSNNIKYLDEILPLKKKYDYILPNIYIKSFQSINKIFGNYFS